MTASEVFRVSLGFIFGPLIGLALLGESVCFSAPLGSCRESVRFISGVGAFVAYPAMVFLGMPLFFYFRKHGWLAWWQVSLGGFLVGALAMLVFALYTGTLSGAFGYTILFGGVGLISGFAFWAIAVLRNSALTGASTGTREKPRAL